MAKELTIGDYSRNGLHQIVDTNWDSNGTLKVTVRDLSEDGGDHTKAMRRLARKAIMYPENTRSSRVINRFTHGGTKQVTFAVSRLEP